MILCAYMRLYLMLHISVQLAVMASIFTFNATGCFHLSHMTRWKQPIAEVKIARSRSKNRDEKQPIAQHSMVKTVRSRELFSCFKLLTFFISLSLKSPLSPLYLLHVRVSGTQRASKKFQVKIARSRIVAIEVPTFLFSYLCISNLGNKS